MLADDAGRFTLADIEGVLFTIGGGLDEDGAYSGNRIRLGGLPLVQGPNRFRESISMKGIINEAFKNDENRNEGENEEGPHKVTAFKKEVF